MIQFLKSVLDLFGYDRFRLYQGWPTQLHHWANIFASILKRASKLLMTNSQYFTFFPSNVFDHLFILLTSFFPHRTFQKPSPLPKFFALPAKFVSLKKVKLDNSKKGRKGLPSGPHVALGPSVGHPCLYTRFNIVNLDCFKNSSSCKTS